jgi:predicted cation transporter
LSRGGGFRRDAVRHLTGFAIAVLGTALALTFALVAYLLLVENDDRHLNAVFEISLVAFAAASVGIGLACLFVGVPLTWILAVNRLENAWIYPLSGVLGGIGVAIVYATLLLPDPQALQTLPINALGLGLPGAMCGWLWWQFARRHLQAARILE